VNWGHCCRGTNSTYNIRFGRSRNVTGPYLDREGNDLLEGGGTLLLESAGNAVGPGHLTIFEHDKKNYFSYHFYDATQRGRSRLGIGVLQWDEEGWPIVEEQLLYTGTIINPSDQ